MTPADLEALVRTVYGEARNQPQSGQRAVLCVVRNRAVIAAAYEKAHGKAHPLFGNGSIYKACHTKAQFSCWNADADNQANLNAIKLLSDLSGVYLTLQMHCVQWLNQDDVTDGATHYCTASVADTTQWTKHATKVKQIGAHVFFKDVS